MRPKLFALLAVSAVALVGCSASEGTPEPTATVTVTAEPSASPEETAQAEPTLIVPEETLSPEDAYLGRARNNNYTLSKMGDKELLELAEDSCEGLAEGVKIPEVYKSGDETKRMAVNLTVRNMAGSQLCPENL